MNSRTTPSLIFCSILLLHFLDLHHLDPWEKQIVTKTVKMSKTTMTQRRSKDRSDVSMRRQNKTKPSYLRRDWRSLRLLCRRRRKEMNWWSLRRRYHCLHVNTIRLTQLWKSTSRPYERSRLNVLDNPVQALYFLLRRILLLPIPLLHRHLQIRQMANRSTLRANVVQESTLKPCRASFWGARMLVVWLSFFPSLKWPSSSIDDVCSCIPWMNSGTVV